MVTSALASPLYSGGIFSEINYPNETIANLSNGMALASSLSLLGHSGAVRSITPLVNESSFISTSNDKTVHLYSLTSAREATEALATNKSESKRSVIVMGAGRRSAKHRSTSESSGSSHQQPSLSSSPLAPASSMQPSVGAVGTFSVAPSLVFTGHRRSVLAAAYLHFERLVASLDPSSLLLWDPVTGQKVVYFVFIFFVLLV